MTKSKRTNIAASVRARLLKLAQESGEEFNYVLTRYALERLLVRLVSSPHRDVFLLKGAMLFRAWSPGLHRPTKDLDLLGSGVPDLDRLARIFRDVCEATVHDDGVVFDPASVRAGRIKEDAEFEGVRATSPSALVAHGSRTSPSREPCSPTPSGRRSRGEGPPSPSCRH